MKKELEKSVQALEAATVDLQNKIQENGMGRGVMRPVSSSDCINIVSSRGASQGDVGNQPYLHSPCQRVTSTDRRPGEAGRAA